jgi:hypothetical protein
MVLGDYVQRPKEASVGDGYNFSTLHTHLLGASYREIYICVKQCQLSHPLSFCRRQVAFLPLCTCIYLMFLLEKYMYVLSNVDFPIRYLFV